MPLIIKSAGFEEYLDPSGQAYIKALILGAPGSGKTPFSACFPQPIIADCERGIMSVASKGTAYAQITSADEMEALLDHLRRECQKPPPERKYQTLVIDTIDSYQKVLIAERLRAERKESLSGWADWGWLDGKMGSIIEKAMNLPMHLVVTMHFKDERDMSADGDDEILVAKSSLKGDIAYSIYRYFDLIGLMDPSYEAVDGERKLVRKIRWHSEPKYPMLRDRSAQLPRFTEVNFVEEDFTQIFDAIAGAVDSLPESGELESVQTDGERNAEAAAEANAEGGPVPNPEVPKGKPAKKAAKKAAAKPKVEPAVQEERTPAEPEPEPEGPPEELVKKALGATHVETIPHKPEPEEPTKPEPEEPKPEPEKSGTKAPGSRTCGDAVAGVQRKPGADGCGKTLSPQNAVKLGIAQLRTGAQLCDACLDEWGKAK